MPTERLSMRRIRDLLRLTYEHGLSHRQVAASLGLSKGAVSMYLCRARTAGVTWPLAEDLTDTALERMLFPGAPQDPEALRPLPNWAYVDAELRSPNVTRALLWEEYRTGQPDAYGYTWFCVAFDAWKGKVSPSMRQHHVAGEKVFVDYAGSTIDVIDPRTGEAHPMKLFVAAVGASSYIFATARPSESLSDWISCHVEMLEAFDGAPAIFVCDNLKAGVTRPDRYEPTINRTYQDLARHYGVVVIPARPYNLRTRPRWSSPSFWLSDGC